MAKKHLLIGTGSGRILSNLWNSLKFLSPSWLSIFPCKPKITPTDWKILQHFHSGYSPSLAPSCQPGKSTTWHLWRSFHEKKGRAPVQHLFHLRIHKTDRSLGVSTALWDGTEMYRVNPGNDAGNYWTTALFLIFLWISIVCAEQGHVAENLSESSSTSRVKRRITIYLQNTHIRQGCFQSPTGTSSLEAGCVLGSGGACAEDLQGTGESK